MPRSIFAVLIASVLAGSLSGCATPSSPQQEPVQLGDELITPAGKLLSQVYVESVTRGQDVDIPWTTQVDTDAFKAALEQSLADIGYKSDSRGAKFRIAVEVHNLAKPGFGRSFTVKSKFRYTISEAGSTKIMPVTAVGTARTKDALYSHERLILARERTLQENIKTFIKEFTDEFGK